MASSYYGTGACGTVSPGWLQTDHPTGSTLSLTAIYLSIGRKLL